MKLVKVIVQAIERTGLKIVARKYFYHPFDELLSFFLISLSLI